MFIRRSHKSNSTVKMPMIIPRKEAQAIRLSCLKGLKSTRIGRMALQGREEGFNKRVIRGGTGSGKTAQHMDGFQRLPQELGLHRAPPVTDDLRPLSFRKIQDMLRIDGLFKHLLRARGPNSPIQPPGHDIPRILIQDRIEVIEEPQRIGCQWGDIPTPEAIGGNGQIMVNSRQRMAVSGTPPRLRKMSFFQKPVSCGRTQMNHIRVTPISTEYGNRSICQVLTSGQRQEGFSLLWKQPVRRLSRTRKAILQGTLYLLSMPSAQSMPLQSQQSPQPFLGHPYLTGLIKHLQKLLLLLRLQPNPSQRPLEPPLQAFFKAWFSMANDAKAFSTSSFSLKRASWISEGTKGFLFFPGRTDRRAANAPSSTTDRIRAKSVWYRPSLLSISPTRPGDRQLSRKRSNFFSAVRLRRRLEDGCTDSPLPLSISSKLRTGLGTLSFPSFFWVSFGTWDSPLSGSLSTPFP